jgi:hypothetical protein
MKYDQKHVVVSSLGVDRAFWVTLKENNQHYCLLRVYPRIHGQYDTNNTIRYLQIEGILGAPFDCIAIQIRTHLFAW